MRIIYVSASSGGGHDSMARALAEAAARTFGAGAQQETVDFYGSPALRGLPWLARVRYHTTWLWWLFCAATDFRVVIRALALVIVPLAVRSLRRRIGARPDVLVAVHFGAAQVVGRLAAAWEPAPLTAVVISDYEAHWAWMAPADLVVVPSARARRRALAVGYRPSQILELELLPSRRAAPVARLSPRPTLSIVAAAGADGTSGPRLCEVLRRLDAAPCAAALEVVAVCGRNLALRRALDALPVRALHLRTAGYVDDLPERLAAADLALVRASGLTVTEALAAGTPTIAFDWHVHEAPNARLLGQHGCGYASRRPAAVAATIVALAADAAQLGAWRRAARHLGQRTSADVVVAELARALEVRP
jgi:processive 1,2-diacylglycerol beta-glucosyltransferase